MLAQDGHVDHGICKLVGMMLNSSEKMARHLVEGLPEEYDEDDKPPVDEDEARRQAAAFALMHGQLDAAWEKVGFRPVVPVPPSSVISIPCAICGEDCSAMPIPYRLKVEGKWGAHDICMPCFQKQEAAL